MQPGYVCMVVWALLLPGLVTGAKVNPPDNRGTEFILMFMQNKVLGNKSFPLELYITTQEKTDVNVNVTSPKWTTPTIDEKFTIKAGEVHKVLINETFRMSGSAVSSKGIQVTADAEVVCYGSNKESLSNDVYLGIPTDALGTEYYAMTYSPASIKSEIGVAATADQTDVNIMLPSTNGDLNVTFHGQVYKKGDNIQLTLDKYETLQLQSSGDLTGTHITSSEPVALFCGNIKTTVGQGNFSDHLVEQLPSVNRWGKQFVTAPIPKRTVGDIFKIIAREDNTVVRITGLADVHLNAGESKTFELSSGTYNFINASKPILVSQFVKTQQSPTEPADPSMMILPPYELFGSDYTFTTPEYSHPEYGNLSQYRYENQFMVVAEETEKDGLLMDGKPLDSSLQWTKIPGTSLVGSFITVPHGSHTVRHVNPLSIFGGYLYGHAYHESYAFPTGMRLAVLHDQSCIPTTSVPGDGIDNDCDNKIDEELCTTENHGKDDDQDGKSDEDCVKVMPIDGLWSNWGPWGACSVSCDDGTQIRQRNCSAPAPKFGGKLCVGSADESQSCYSGTPCPIDINRICNQNKTAVVANPTNCAQYYDCNQLTTLLGQNHLLECPYPKLFSVITFKCEDFDVVNCLRRQVQMSPCDYVQNICNGSDPNCIPCTKRLPSCVGNRDGANPFTSAVTFGPEYKICLKNRTIDVKKCSVGYFNPQAKRCLSHNAGTLSFYCRQHPSALLGHPNNCAKFYNCSKPGMTLQAKTDECRYPDLFSAVTEKCGNFTDVRCGVRTEPQEPCEYDQNLCPATNSSCSPCPQRHANCKGLRNGTQPFSGKEWSSDFAVCLLNRTMDQNRCHRGFFHPVSLHCTDIVKPSEATDVCKASPGKLFASSQNCAHYYDCSKNSTNVTKAYECKYPDLFSTKTQKCERFETVNCTTRKEPQAPCEYTQNLCNTGNTTCTKCPYRLPSCIGKADGTHGIPSKLWKSDFMVCYKNRTLNVTKCHDEYFHPNVNKCLKDVSKVDAVDYCSANPFDVVQSPDNCAQYYNCSRKNTLLGKHVMECRYPDLFSNQNHRCQRFETVNCTKRMEPQAPCEYVKNLCNLTSLSCVECPKRLPTCKGLQDGVQPFPARLWKPDFINCYKNRTTNITKCLDGYFHPSQHKCTKDVLRIDAKSYCNANPNDIIATPDNCAQYYNCSRNYTRYGNHVMECKYPDLFSTATLKCENFTGVVCNKRKEPQAPCDYNQNLCNTTDPSCLPCMNRLHSCVGLPDGDNPVPGGLWTPEYVVCYKNRTLATKHCRMGNFDPATRVCTAKVDLTNIDSICKTRSNIVMAMGSNCAKYYNCSSNSSSSGHHVQECKYPDLFSATSNQCEQFENVNCQNRTEPMAPCQYDQNLCNQTDPKCQKCPLRLPSCIGQSDGNHAFPTRLWKPDYITCYKNRTLNISKCYDGYFHPNLNKCTKDVDRVDAVDYCAANQNDIMPTTDNCAQYYNCSASNTQLGDHVIQCRYPDFFSLKSRSCEKFEKVNCTTRTTPQAPCEYRQNLCNNSDPTCVNCTRRLPSCIGLTDGNQVFSTRLWKPDYITCYKNRTLNIEQCKNGYFHPRTKNCTKDVVRVDATDYCASNPSDIIPVFDNCAQYYNCSERRASLGNHTMECKYPDLFSVQSHTCQDFQTVQCSSRKEPQAPCEYFQNLCNTTSSTCKKCPTRLPSCRGLNDGAQPFPTRLWKPDFIVCYKNRTVNITSCQSGYFHPLYLNCSTDIARIDAVDYCTANPNDIVSTPDNCAQYYNCSKQLSGYSAYVQECKYPDLFSVNTMKCEVFTNITCSRRNEPQAPCAYAQNQCNSTVPSCRPCVDRLHSCVGLPDGDNAVPGGIWTDEYIVCYKNRTMANRHCKSGNFDPIKRTCTSKVDQTNVDSVCKAKPYAVIPMESNCAKYYNCSLVMSNLGHHIQECKYPDLFSTVSGHCEQFETVDCYNRTEPMAPCQYDQNLCNKTNAACERCPKRLPSCIGLNDGKHSFPGKLWKADYITCYKNRTVSIDKCQMGYFNPNLNKCTPVVLRVDAVDYCAANPASIVPIPDNCAQYFNCTDRYTQLGKHVVECKYPDLFSVQTSSCERFENVTCSTRKEPQAPCEYDQHLCSNSTPSCKKCPDRLPSCVGLSDGKYAFPTRMWKSDFIICYKNRTINITSCLDSYFHPRSNNCTRDVARTDAVDYCTANPLEIVPTPDNCAQYYNCSIWNTTIGNHVKACKYPDLFSSQNWTCQNFETVKCGRRLEPQAPCGYAQNLCKAPDPSCKPCADRLHSCIGLPDGDNGVPGGEWTDEYIVCYKNRTLDNRQCANGNFDPVKRICTTKVDQTNINGICKVKPTAIIPVQDNCAKYYNCSVKVSKSGYHIQECKYPDLFSTITNQCEQFENVSCVNRTEPMAPCQYDQNICSKTDPSCERCPKRLPSCISLSDGNHAFPGKLWKANYITCYKNRTMQLQKCQNGYFHPSMNNCTKDLLRVDAVDYCAANPSDIVPTPDNCAQYYNCSQKSTMMGNHVIECRYPDLFSVQTGLCEQFENVTCTSRREPRAPCEYEKNVCRRTNVSCVQCLIRLPSCIRLSDGKHAFPTRLWKPDYVICYKNRTVNITKCQHGYFHPQLNYCLHHVARPDAVDYCAANPSDIVPTPDNCAQYYNCSSRNTSLGDHVTECPYPDLFSVQSLTCQQFETVTCGNRMEPQAPCQYRQNLCDSSNVSCSSCPNRLPSCIGLKDGNQTFPSRQWKHEYIVCFKNRTIAVEKCPAGYFHPRHKNCTNIVVRPDAVDYCSSNTSDIVPTPDNCAQYYNCSDKQGLGNSYVMECPYPDLFSLQTFSCENFTSIDCHARSEPQAPCQYDQNICDQHDASCISCPVRLPSCIGIKDGVHPFPTRLWKPDYMTCYQNRTLKLDKCKEGYFHPTENACREYLKRPDAEKYCTANPTDILPIIDNCAQYFNCTRFGFSPSDYVQECTYPDLFSTLSFTCQDFTNVHCSNRSEPQAPCQYDQNICKHQGSSCEPCPERLPSCIGMGDGDQPVVSKLWTDIHILCYRNRTMAVRHCPSGAVFDPNHKQCISKIPAGDIDQFCKANPGLVKAHETNCAQYYNCSNQHSKYGHFLQECRYPELFSAVAAHCQPFENVTCRSLHEPQPPCEYLQNLCNSSDPGCIPCSDRLPSCIGLPDGQNAVKGKLWKPAYVECYRNRTIKVKHCQSRYFHPQYRTCVDPVQRVDVQGYCKANPGAIVRAEDNCAQYYNCSLLKSRFGKFVAECRYPDLFSSVTLTCEMFNKTTCTNRREPQAPCEYEQNLCDKSNTSCMSCSARLPSCVGLSDGPQPIPFLMWTDAYAECYQNRTMDILHCPNGYFHPRKRQCMSKVDPVDVHDYCQKHPYEVFANLDSCAKYFNCSAKHNGFQVECKYPDLFSETTHRCQNFTSVSCDSRPEPETPCQYEQNLCKYGSNNCVVCPERLPSCIGMKDGLNIFPGKEWQSSYIECLKNRTMVVTKCPKGYFHPNLKQCLEEVKLPDVPYYCKSHPNAMLPNPDNCAQFFNCSLTVNGVVPVMECTYPDLYSTDLELCMRFTKVDCDTKGEPQAPCEYKQNRCLHGNSSCIPCPERLPSCIGKPDGAHPFTGKEWTAYYITCYRNRTVGIDKCPTGSLFDPEQNGCITKLDSTDILSYCRYNRNAIIDHPTNCALYFNCSIPVTDYGSYLMECEYPDLFSSSKSRCVPYSDALCGPKHKPVAPCDYLQNQCKPREPSCTPCKEKYPSCVGKRNGLHPVPNHEWESNFINCKDNRTISLDSCRHGQYFHPTKFICTDSVENVDVPKYCPVHSNGLVPDATNCARYFNCSSKKSVLGRYLVECNYPDLFSPDISSCSTFENVSCLERLEPQAPCQYKQNLCTARDGSCQPCAERLPSCVELVDGKHRFPGRKWQPDYIICYKNRTMTVTKCSDGFFNPRTNACETFIQPIDVPEFCKANPSALLPVQDSCAKFYNCSENPMSGDLPHECHYPDLFSTVNLQCKRFVTVNCTVRQEPMTPCEYQENHCKVNDSSCNPCAERLPSCIGLTDGLQVFANQTWTNKYIRCYKNRTMSVEECPKQSFFHPKELTCIEKVHGDDLLDLCRSDPTRILPHPINCAQFYNCSSPGISHRMECEYPSLFNPNSRKCENYTAVDCEEKTEPQAPCEYEQFLCDPLDLSCDPCPDRQPSCVGKIDGLQEFPGKRWRQEYIKCYLNRTRVYKCDDRDVFSPFTKECVGMIQSKEIPDFCRSNPKAVLPDPTDCSRFFNCSLSSENGNYEFQCTYPDLFSEFDTRCVSFNLVNCGMRKEPMEPCMYGVNLCKSSDKNCKPCHERLPSCVSLPNGNNAIPGHLWSASYIVCLQNRTVDVQKCTKGIFDPNTRTCSTILDPKYIDRICKANPKLIVAHKTNCAQYFNCSKPETALGQYLMECSYPMLFDRRFQKCHNFSKVVCGIRKEPQAPCEYFQNLCMVGNETCQPCADRLPSCVGQLDGANMILSKPWSRYFVRCSYNRTIKTDLCREGFFHPFKKMCTKELDPVDVSEFCLANPKALMPDATSCGKYINCSAPSDQKVSECVYPQLFSAASQSCNNFTSVFCGKRPEPQAPCEYDQNHCHGNNRDCQPCPYRLPSCRGLQDGLNPVAGRLWTNAYVECFVNRTINVRYCVTTFFDPHRRTCTDKVNQNQINEICTANPDAIFSDPFNCARYFNCSNKGIPPDEYRRECAYPKLFSTESGYCITFSNVSCGHRFEPQAPCEYKQNLCGSSSQCIPCSDRMPSCVGLSDGENSIPGHRWSNGYINCHKNRTLSKIIERCEEGFFNPILRHCTKYISKGLIRDFCQSRPTALVPNGENAAQFFDCSKTFTDLSHPYLHECPYPNLFDEETLSCVNFTLLPVGIRPIPQAPCEYAENHCKPTDGPACKPCRQRLFGCVGLPDGDNAIEGKAWESVYIRCYKNRTLSTKECEDSVFNPIKRICVRESKPDSISEVCRQHPDKIIPHEGSCSLYYNCSVKVSLFGPLLPIQLRECPYPQLFSTVFQKCMDFQSVRCGDRNEVHAPCQYLQNQCKVSDNACAPCLDRLPSCIGLPDGDNAVPGKLWTEKYLHCFKNRTLDVQKCRFGFYFHPYERECLETVEQVDVPEYCDVHPFAIISSEENCAQYYNCSIYRLFRVSTGKDAANQECHYPNLFSPITRRCGPFTKVNCGNRYEPISPCEYSTNRCPLHGDIGCVPCEERFPSCVGRPDGLNAIYGKEYTAYYTDCYVNRTMTVKKCEQGFFDPYLRMCVKEINSGNIVGYCQRNGQAILPHPTNCAWFYNCSVNRVTLQSVYPYEMMYVQECPYPKLFSIATMRCESYQHVSCGIHFEPQAPCEYFINRCDPTEDRCVPCPNRIPSCKALSDGYRIINNLYDGLKYFVHCENNRTISYEICSPGNLLCGESSVFFTTKSASISVTTSPPTPILALSTKPTPLFVSTFANTNTSIFISTTPRPGFIKNICDFNSGLITPNALHCGQYYNCTLQSAPYLFECTYPQLFDSVLRTCRDFRNVQCGERPEFVAPCEYQQNVCSFGDVNCIPCAERLPSCRGLSNGNYPFPWKLWSPDYITCSWNRTINIGHCEKGIFDPNRRMCISEIITDHLAEYCDSNPSGVLPNPANCAQYFDCSDIYRIGADFEKECQYPLLFHPVMRTCVDYNMVDCGRRYEPVTPCEYEQNQCHQDGCVRCEQRFISCLGKADGQHVFPGKEYTPMYVRCQRNRTIAVEKCGGGIFDPVTNQCALHFGSATISHYCQANMGQVKPHPLNCAQFVDCGIANYLSLDVIKECEYPKLFSPLTLQCEDFENMQCGPRHEPKAPCEYLQNLCNGSDPTCRPCIERLPSCIGLPDGNNPVLNRTWLAHYIFCYKERTMEVKICPSHSVFDPYLKKCETDQVQPLCQETPATLLLNPKNCAQYYDCNKENTELGHFLMECPYPQLFDGNLRRCRDYRSVECQTRFEPKSPCEYEINQCQGPHCKPCNDRFPSCSGKPDGLNPYPGRELTGFYIVCKNSRYIETGICIVDKILDPTRRVCTNPADTEIVDAFCAANPGALIASLTNCAQFYECGLNATEPAHYRQECIYPMLYSLVENTCKNFSEVQCGQRYEPVAPCEFEQYHCISGDITCHPCQQRIPSCVGLPDGKNAYPNSIISHEYIICEAGRTIEIGACWSGYFDPVVGDCVSFPYGLVPSVYGAVVCNDNLLSGVPDSSIKASSVFGINDKTHNYGPERARLNLTETVDANGVTQIGGWVAEKGNLQQWIQIELKEPSLIRGITTQGRNGCCQQWVSKYRVLHSTDCQSWSTVGGFNVTDAFFKANSDEDTPVTNMFQCPVIAKCIRINPLDWKNNIAMRLDVVGCQIGTMQQTTTQPIQTTTAPPVVSTAVPTNTGAGKTKNPITTKGVAVNVNTGATTKLPAAIGTTPKSGTLSGGKHCITSCKGKPNGYYQSCKGCGIYITCNWQKMYGNRPCPHGLKWDDKLKRCDFKSSTCP